MTYLRAGKPRGCTFAARTDSAALSFAEKWAAGLGAVLPSKEMEELQALAGELRDTSKWRVSSAQRTILLNAADAVAALWHIKSADAIASRSATGTTTKEKT